THAIKVNGGGDDDTLTVEYPVATGAVSVDGGGQADVLNVYLSDAADVLQLSGTAVTVTGAATTSYTQVSVLNLETRGGADTLTVSDTHAGETFISTGDLADTVTLSDTSGYVSLKTDSGADTVNVRGIDDVTRIDTGSGNDVVNVTSTSPTGGGVLTNIDALLQLIGSGGSDQLVVDASGDTTALTGMLSNTLIDGLGLSTDGLEYYGFEDLDLTLGAAGDQLDIVATHAGTTDVLGLTGDDTINITRISGPTTVDAGLGADEINVTVQVDLPFDEVSPILSLLTVRGGGDDDLLTVTSGSTIEVDDPNFDDVGQLTATAITGLEMPQGIVYSDMEDLVINLGTGRDNFTILSTHAGTTTLNADTGLGFVVSPPEDPSDQDPNATDGGVNNDPSTFVQPNPGFDTINVRSIAGITTINAGFGDDTINVGTLAPATGGVANDIDALLTIDGGDDTDTINVDDTGELNADSLLLTSTLISGLGTSNGIAYSTTEFLNISMGSGGNTIDVQSTSATTAITTGTNDDLIHVGSLAPALGGTLNLLAGALSLDGESGNDTLYVDDTGDTSANTGSLTESLISGLGSNGIAYANLEGLQLALGSGGNTLDVTGTMQQQNVRVVTLINTGLGNDDVTVSLDSATDGPVSINLEAGNDQLDATLSTLGLYLLGGLGSDVILGGQGNDVIFGDRGVITYRDENDLVTTRHGIEVLEQTSSDPGSSFYVPVQLTNLLAPATVRFATRDDATGGNDAIYGQGGNDDIYGGAAGDIIVGGSYVAGA
ncbi:MAG: hypothetical protein KDB23_27270, partial [Planctomycetales bacterium]|nr:hypothetical protein [Planctomycetales bacterium]